MRRLILALRVFWLTLLRPQFAAKIRQILEQSEQAMVAPPEPETPTAVEKPRAIPPQVTPLPAGRNDALTLLSVLQREARFVDFVMESLDGYTDAQIGAAVRDIHRDCARVIERIFGLRAIISEAEGSFVNVPRGYDAARFRVLGEIGGSEPIRARVLHRGWEATRCQLPIWSGTAESTMIIAPAELQAEGAPPPRLGEGYALPNDF